jgi:GNAT superfamily N-acetyltransferase
LNESYFQWKYQRNPYLEDDPLIYLAMHGRRAIGMRGFFGVQWECGVPAQRFNCLYADDMVIAPEHRNRGLMSVIMTSAFKDLAAKGYNYVFNLSAGPVTLRSSLSMGWRSAGWVRPMRWRSWRALGSGALGRLKSLPIMRWTSYIDSLQFARLRRFDDIDLTQVNCALQATSSISVKDTPQCTSMADLVKGIGDNGRIHHVRDETYFHWRFQNPYRRYRFLYCGEDRLEGYLVLQERTSEAAVPNVVNIVDWEASNERAQESLLESAFAMAKGRRLVIWSATLPSSTIASLKRHGFRFQNPPPSPAEPAILVRALGADQLEGEWELADRPLLDLESWDLRMLYSMHG